jgi:hypothetical protein
MIAASVIFDCNGNKKGLVVSEEGIITKTDMIHFFNDSKVPKKTQMA